MHTYKNTTHVLAFLACGLADSTSSSLGDVNDTKIHAITSCPNKIETPLSDGSGMTAKCLCLQPRVINSTVLQSWGIEKFHYKQFPQNYFNEFLFMNVVRSKKTKMDEKRERLNGVTISLDFDYIYPVTKINLNETKLRLGTS